MCVCMRIGVCLFSFAAICPFRRFFVNTNQNKCFSDADRNRQKNCLRFVVSYAPRSVSFAPHFDLLEFRLLNGKIYTAAHRSLVGSFKCKVGRVSKCFLFPLAINYFSAKIRSISSKDNWTVWIVYASFYGFYSHVCGIVTIWRH